MSKKDRDKYNEWLEKAEEAEQLLWELYDEDVEGDSNLANYMLKSWKSTHQLTERIEAEIKGNFISDSMSIDAQLSNDQDN